MQAGKPPLDPEAEPERGLRALPDAGQAAPPEAPKSDHTPSTKPPRRRLRKALKWTGAVLGGWVFLVLVLVLSIHVAPVRSFVAAQVSSALASVFAGKLSIRRIGQIGFREVSGVDAEVWDAQGHRVLDVHGLSVRVAWPELIWQMLVSKPNPTLIQIARVDIEHADVTLRDDGTGLPTLAQAFAPRAPSAPSTGPSSVVRLRIDRVFIKHAWVHGRLGSIPPLDADTRALEARVSFDEHRAQVDVQKFGLHARGLPNRIDAEGQVVDAALTLPGNPGAAIRLHARFAGQIAAVRSEATFQMDGEELHGTLAAPEATPAAIRALVPGLELRHPLALTAKFDGKPSDLTFDARARNEDGQIEVSGSAALSQPMKLVVHVDVRDFDSSGFVRSAPKTRVALLVDVRATQAPSGELSGDYTLNLLTPSRIFAQDLPKVSANGAIRFEPAEPALDLKGQMTIAEAGAPTRLSFSFQTRGLNLEVHGETALDAPPRLAALTGVSAQGSLEFGGRWQLATDAVSAQFRAKLRNVRRAENTVAELSVAAEASGKLADPSIQASVSAQRLAFGVHHLTSAEVIAHGSLARLSLSGNAAGSAAGVRGKTGAVTKTPERVTFQTVLMLKPVPTLEQTELVLGRADTRLALSVKSLRFGDKIRVQELVLEGAGRAEVSLTLGRTLEQLEARTDALDIERILRVASIETPVRSAKLTLNVSYAAFPRPHGFVTGSVEKLSAATIDAGSAKVDLKFGAGRVSGTLDADLGRAGEIKLATEDADFLEPPFTRARLLEWAGRISVSAALELPFMVSLFGTDLLPIERADGNLKLELELARERKPSAAPTVHLKVLTKGLALTGKRDKAFAQTQVKTAGQARESQAWTVSGIDVDADLALDGSSGKTALTGRAFDSHGTLASVEASVRVPLAALWAGKLESSALLDLPVALHLSMPERDLDKLPPLIRPAGNSGTVTLDVVVQGTARAPQLKVSATGRRLRALDSRGMALDANLEAKYETSQGELSLSILTKERKFAELTANWTGPLLDMVSQDLEQPSRIRGQAKLKLDRLPLAGIPEVSLLQVRGQLSGNVELLDFGQDARLDAQLDVTPLRLGQAKFSRAFVTLSTRDSNLRGRVSLEEVGGSLGADASAHVEWGNRVMPRFVFPVDAHLSARHSRVAALVPLFTKAFSEFDGRLNAELSAHVEPDQARLSGEATFSEGIVQLPQIGQRFHDVGAHAKLAPGAVVIDGFTANGVTGKVTGNAKATFVGSELQSMQAHANIGKREKLPITIEGVEVGDAWGNADVTLRIDESKKILIAINVPELHVDLAQADAHSVQSLEPLGSVRFGLRDRAGEFVSLPLQPLVSSEPGPARGLAVDVKLGNQVWIRREPEVLVQLAGALHVESGETSRITGQIDLRGGTLDISGKKFEIEHGTVSFDGKAPPDPTIVATARWDAVDYQVYADYTGTAKKGKLTLRTEPPLTQDQVVSLIMFGTTDGALGSSSSDSTATAVGVAGGTATQGLNHMLSNVTQLDVSTRVDTSTGTARPELVVQLTPRVSAHLTRALGEPAPFQPLDRTFLTFDFRLGTRWSLSALVGDKGASALDLIWRKRY